MPSNTVVYLQSLFSNMIRCNGALWLFVLGHRPLGLLAQLGRCSQSSRSQCGRLGLLGGYNMHQLTRDGVCVDACLRLPMLQRQWQCGRCASVETRGYLPAGPYIASGYSERITLPQPPTPSDVSLEQDNAVLRTACPHQEANLTDWHAASTWPSGNIPVDGQDVTLPLDTKVIVRQTVVERLGLVTIPTSSSLVFDEAQAGIEMHVTGMDVKGSLIAGSETCRMETPITITLHGSRPVDASTNQPAPTYKGISVRGTLSLHGQRYFRTWTRLSKTAHPGDKVLLLQDPVNWRPKQSLVLVTTAMKDSREWHRNEIHTVRM
jgi:G8 domain